jgi:hypothetical protein
MYMLSHNQMNQKWSLSMFYWLIEQVRAYRSYLIRAVYEEKTWKKEDNHMLYWLNVGM